jgi:trigger factor
VKVELTDGENLVRILKVELPAETVNDETEKAYTKIRQDITLKGYRKGKAPMNVIRKNYEDQVKGDVAEELIKNTYFMAIQEKTIRVAAPPTVTDAGYTDEGGFHYTAEVEVIPQIDAINCDGLTLSAPAVEVTDDEVNEYVEYLRKQLAEYRVLDRPAADGDIVVVDLEKLLDPNLVLKTDKFSDAEVDLSNPVTVTEFKEQLPGMKAGDEKEIEVKYQDDYPDAAFAGAEIKYLCKVKQVKERLLPEFDDGLAKRSGKAETALELRMAMRKEIAKQKEDSNKRQLKNQAIEQLCQNNQIPVPEAMVNHYLDSVIADFKKEDENLDEKVIRERYRPIGTTTIRWNILLNRLAELEKIEVSPQDTENLIKRFADNYKTTPEKAKEALEQSGKIREIRDSLLEEKVLDFLIDRAEVVTTENEKK